MIDKDQAKHIASLARLKLKNEELESFSQQLSSVLDYIQKIEEVSSDDVGPLIHPSSIKREYRKDEIKQELSIEEKLQNAPEKSGNLVKVPPVVG